MPPMQSRDGFGQRGNLSCAPRCPAPRRFTVRTMRARRRSGPCGRFGFPVPAAGQGPASPKLCAPPKTNGLLDGFCPEPGQQKQTALNANGRLLFLQLADIVWLEAAAQRTALHVGKETHLLDDCFSAVAAKLPADHFLRIGSSALVSVGQIRGLRRTCQGGWQLLLRSGTRLTLLPIPGQTLRQTSPCFSTSIDPLVCTR
jgi:hypothetical protein